MGIISPKTNKVRSYLDELYSVYYREIPVDIITFLKDPYYLGKSTGYGKAIFPGWIPVLKDISRNDHLYIVVFTGAIGIGKSTIALYYLAYCLYKIMCLKDPWKYFELADAGKMAVSFFNLTKTLGSSRGFNKLQKMLRFSKWFYDHGGVIRGKTDPYMDLPLFDWKLSSPYSKGFAVLGEDLIGGVMDEVDSPDESEGQRRRILKAYTASIRRFESRFVRQGECISRFFLVASKQEEFAFLETFIKEMEGYKKILVVDKAQWEIKPKTNYCGKRFYVVLGDAYTPSKLFDEYEVAKGESVGSGESRQIVSVPVEHKEDFMIDLTGSLRDLAGISVKGLRKYKLFPSERFVYDCFDDNKNDPCSQEVVEVGLNDEFEYISLIDLSKIRVSKSVERCIHMDTAFSSDCLGLAMSCVGYWAEKQVENEDGSFSEDVAPVVETDFAISFKARPGDRIPLHKIRKLILDLRRYGFKIKMFSADLKLASEDTTQLLTRAKIECEYFSLDKNIKPYIDFRNVVFEKRWICHRHGLLFFELKHLEYDKEKGKIDHPEKVKDVITTDDGDVKEVVLMGSKDLSDAVAGSVSQAIKYAKKPLDVKSAIDALRSLNRKGVSSGLPPDWFISYGNRKEDDRVLVSDNDKHGAMVEVLKGLKANKFAKRV